MDKRMIYCGYCGKEHQEDSDILTEHQRLLGSDPRTYSAPTTLTEDDKAPKSHLDILKKAHPNFPWPAKGEKSHYPEELGATMGDKRRFGFPPKQYTLTFRTSSEASAITQTERYNAEGKQALITYNPTRLETYGVWIR